MDWHEDESLTISGITRKRGRSEVEASAGVMQVVPDLVFFEYCLREGMTLSYDKWQSLVADSCRELCAEQALRFLEQRGHGTNELATKLKARGHRPDAVKAAIARLESVGLLDDVVFAKAYTQEKLEFAGWGRRRIQMELRRKGIARELIDATIEELCDGDDDAEFAAALGVAERKAKSLAREEDPWKRRRKLLAFLARRGFTPNVAYRAADAAFADSSDFTA